MILRVICVIFESIAKAHPKETLAYWRKLIQQIFVAGWFSVSYNEKFFFFTNWLVSKVNV